MTANFNTNISVKYPYYSTQAQSYTETYYLNEIITVNEGVGPFTYRLLTNQTINIVDSVMSLGPICYGVLSIEVGYSGGSATATTTLQSGYAKMNEYAQTQIDQKGVIIRDWPTYINNRNKPN